MKIIKYLTVALLVVLVSKKVHVKEDSLSYDAIKQTASFKGQDYIGVKAYNPTVTPPNIENPALKPITLIKNQNYENKGYGSSNQLRLYGIPVTKNFVEIKNSSEKVIGKYWKKEKIAQFDNGAVYVAIIATHIANYKKVKPDKTKKPSIQNITKSLAEYGITYDNTLLPKILGTIQQGHQRFELSGYMLYPANQTRMETMLEEAIQAIFVHK